MKHSIRTFAFCATLLVILSFSSHAQSIIDPSDPVVEYNPASPPTAPAYFTPLVKWVRTLKIANSAVQKKNPGWTGDTRCKAYTYNGTAFRVLFPKSYNPTANDGKKYPLIVFLHGQGENDATYKPPTPNYDNEWQLLQGPPQFDSAIQNGTYDGYVLAPQLQNPASGSPTVFYYGILNDILNIVKYMINNNKVDPYHIILNGLSEGGVGCWDFMNDFPTYFAALTPMSSPITFVPDSTFISNKRYTPIWCSQGGVDTHPLPSETKNVADSMANYGVNFKETIYPSLGHLTWWNFWKEAGFWPFVNNAYSSNPWPLYGKNQFWPGETINATIGVNPGFSQYQWRYNGNVITNATSNEIHVTSAGLYDARVLRDSVWSDWSHIPVAVRGNVYRIEAENWAAMNGVQLELTKDVDGNLDVTGITKNDWMDYTISPVLPGIYTLKLRVAAAATGAVFQIRGSDSSVLATVNVPKTGGSQVWQTIITNVSLNAGTTNIRIKSTSTTAFNINWMEFSLTGFSTLPIKYVYFNSICTGDAVRLNWQTAVEQNSREFSIQRSSDGANWMEISRVAAAGQSTQPRDYSYLDRTAALSSVNLYRVVEYDMDGKESISSVVKSSCSSVRGGELTLYPNPTTGQSSLSLKLTEQTKVSIQIVDGKGALIQQNQMLLPAGTTTLPVDMSSYSKGIYSITVRYGTEIKTMKIIKE